MKKEASYFFFHNQNTHTHTQQEIKLEGKRLKTSLPLLFTIEYTTTDPLSPCPSHHPQNGPLPPPPPPPPPFPQPPFPHNHCQSTTVDNTETQLKGQNLQIHHLAPTTYNALFSLVIVHGVVHPPLCRHRAHRVAVPPCHRRGFSRALVASVGHGSSSSLSQFIVLVLVTSLTTPMW